MRKKKPTSNELVDDHKDKKKDGLSIKDLSTLNKTLLGNGIRDSLYKRICFGEII